MLKLTDYITDHKAGLAVQPARWTDIQHDRVAGPNTALGDAEADMAAAMAAADFDSADGLDLGRELYASLYEADVMESAKPQPWASSALDIAKSIPEWDEMMAYTQGDRDISAIGAADMLDAIRDQVIEMRTAYQEQQDQEQEQNDEAGDQGAADGQQGGDSADGQGEAADGQGEATDGDADGQPQDGQGETETQGDGGECNSDNGQADPNGINEDCGDEAADGQGEAAGWQPTQEQADKIREAMRAAIKRTVDEAGELQETLRGAGAGDRDESEDNTDRAELIKKIRANKRFADLLKKAGRIAQMPSARPAKTDDAGYDAKGVKESGDIAAVLPSELALLADPPAVWMVYKKIAEEKLLTVKRAGKKPLGRGDVVLLVDESGSMKGDRHDIAQAMAMATVLNMTKDRRNTTVIGYGKSVNAKHGFTQYRTATANGRPVSWAAGLQAIASRSANGGTNFDPALRAGLAEIKSNKRADLIFLTDGDASVSRSVLNSMEKMKKSNGLRITTILIGGGHSAAVEAISDTVIKVAELDINGAAKAIGAARKK